ncbi:Uncharacterized protein dnm_068420 [Desulfonema magnum]|uniref:Uncharacterized protein n=1 Tax=Desulfonema magnum TaxID=45655 RepID=A0A975BSB7_9BACT|nr:Uncharacterized protein dnm_068420 [Desulfonema magnum]
MIFLKAVRIMERRIFGLPPKHSSVVHMPDGTTVTDSCVFVKVYMKVSEVN